MSHPIDLADHKSCYDKLMMISNTQILLQSVIVKSVV